ncbi:MAG: hypothetical protein ACXV7F_09710 [Methylomonas sp.]
MNSTSIPSFHAAGLDVKTVDALLYGWGEWRQRKQDAYGYASKTMAAMLIDGAISFGERVMKSMVPHGAMFCMDDRASIYMLIDGYCDSLDTQQKAVMLAYYSLMPKPRYTDDERADKLGLSVSTCKRIRTDVRSMAKNFLQGRIFVA